MAIWATAALVQSNVPVAVTQTGALSGKTVVAIAVGASHCLVACSDGTAIAWGLNSTGQLGIGSIASSPVPVAVTNSSGVLMNKTVVAVAAGSGHSLAFVLRTATLVRTGVTTLGASWATTP